MPTTKSNLYASLQSKFIAFDNSEFYSKKSKIYDILPCGIYQSTSHNLQGAYYSNAINKMGLTEQELDFFIAGFNEHCSRFYGSPYVKSDSQDQDEYLFFGCFLVGRKPEQFMPELYILLQTPNQYDTKQHFVNITLDATPFVHDMTSGSLSPYKINLKPVNKIQHRPIVLMLITSFLRKNMPLCAVNGVAHHLLLEMDNPSSKSLYWRQAALRSFIYAIRASTVESMRKLLHYKSHIGVAAILKHAYYLNLPENRDAINVWLKGDKRIAVAMLFPRDFDYQHVNNLSAFSCANIMRKHCLIDKGSYRAIPKLPSEMVVSLFTNNNNSEIKLLLYWLAHSRHKKIGKRHLSAFYYRLAAQVFDDRLDVFRFFMSVNNPSQAQRNRSAVVRALDISYGLILDAIKRLDQSRISRTAFEYVLYGEYFTSMTDYLFSDECENRLLALNSKTTPSSLKRKVEAWHLELKLKSTGGAINYNINIPSINLNGYIFTPINSNIELYVEGVEMDHCVFSYHKRINNGHYLVFKVTSQGGDERATLGLNCSGGSINFYDNININNSVHFDQCFGRFNSRISENLKGVLPDFIKHLNTNFDMSAAGVLCASNSLECRL